MIEVIKIVELVEGLDKGIILTGKYENIGICLTLLNTIVSIEENKKNYDKIR